MYIGVQLLSEQDGDEGEEKQYSGLFAAIRTILIAELVMSLFNVIGVAAAAKGSMLLLVLGLAISIPLVVFGSTMMIRLMERFPVIVTLGAALVGSAEKRLSAIPHCTTWWSPANGCTRQAPWRVPGWCLD